MCVYCFTCVCLLCASRRSADPRGWTVGSFESQDLFWKFSRGRCSAQLLWKCCGKLRRLAESCGEFPTGRPKSRLVSSFCLCVCCSLLCCFVIAYWFANFAARLYRLFMCADCCWSCFVVACWFANIATRVYPLGLLVVCCCLALSAACCLANSAALHYMLFFKKQQSNNSCFYMLLFE